MADPISCFSTHGNLGQRFRPTPKPSQQTLLPVISEVISCVQEPRRQHCFPALFSLGNLSLFFSQLQHRLQGPLKSRSVPVPRVALPRSLFQGMERKVCLPPGHPSGPSVCLVTHQRSQGYGELELRQGLGGTSCILSTAKHVDSATQPFS